MDYERLLPIPEDESVADELLRPFREIYTEQYLSDKIREHEDQLAPGMVEESEGAYPTDWLELWRDDLERYADRSHMQPAVRLAFSLSLLGNTQSLIAEECAKLLKVESVAQRTVSTWLKTAWASVQAEAECDPFYGWYWVYWQEVNRD